MQVQTYFVLIFVMYIGR